MATVALLTTLKEKNPEYGRLQTEAAEDGKGKEYFPECEKVSC